MKTLANYHVIDPHNIGDLLSSPLQYFPFPGFENRAVDIRSTIADPLTDDHILIGGGGLLFQRFLDQIKALRLASAHGKAILWGVGQQTYAMKKLTAYRAFNYADYVDGFDLVGLRDFDVGQPWVPCVSCMHAAFDKPRRISHDFVVFSHRKFRIQPPTLPHMTNANMDLETVLDFLGSGETILTSSFHGAYWGTLLGRKVIAFPFTSKFMTLKHSPAIYPVQKWSSVKWRLAWRGKTFYERKDEQNYTCAMDGWQAYQAQAQVYPEALQECRDRNRWFYEQVMNLITT